MIPDRTEHFAPMAVLPYEPTSERIRPARGMLLVMAIVAGSQATKSSIEAISTAILVLLPGFSRLTLSIALFSLVLPIAIAVVQYICCVACLRSRRGQISALGVVAGTLLTTAIIYAVIGIISAASQMVQGLQTGPRSGLPGWYFLVQTARTLGTNGIAAAMYFAFWRICSELKRTLMP